MTSTSNNIDSGWAWMILFACCFIEFLYIGLLKSLSVLLPILTEQFQTHTWIIGISITLIATVKDFSSPAVSFLTKYADYRLLGMTGGLLVGLSLTCTSFVSDVRLLILFMSILNGIGLAFVRLPATVLLSLYFDYHYPLASGAFYACGSLGLMICVPFTQVLQDVYGWRGSLLVLGGVNLHLTAICVLFRSQRHYEYNKTADYSRIDDSKCSPQATDKEIQSYGCRNETLNCKENKLSYWVDFLGLSVFKNFSFIAVCLSMATFMSSFAGWTVYFIPHCLAKGLTPYEASFAASVAGVTYFIGHFVYVPFLNRNLITVRGAIYISGITAGVSLLFGKFVSDIVGIVITNSIYTFGVGVMCLLDVRTKSVLDKESLNKGFGWRVAVGGLFKSLPGFVVGWIYEQTGSYDGGFIFIATLPLAGVFVLCVDQVLEKRDSKVKREKT